MTNEESVAREDIRRATHDYMVAADAFYSGECDNAEQVIAQFAPDACVEFAGFPPVPGFKVSGTDAMRARFRQWQAPVANPIEEAPYFVRHNITTSSINICDRFRSTAKTYFFVVTGIGLDHMGMYNDSLICTNSTWLFTHRRISLSWRAKDSRFPPI